ncbi:MAG: hypothetical protein EBT22_01770 [Chloroflexi bacterium]|nr:hypothetical protein [Chloroflexota bacterium]
MSAPAGVTSGEMAAGRTGSGGAGSDGRVVRLTFGLGVGDLNAGPRRTMGRFALGLKVSSSARMASTPAHLIT